MIIVILFVNRSGHRRCPGKEGKIERERKRKKNNSIDRGWEGRSEGNRKWRSPGFVNSFSHRFARTNVRNYVLSGSYNTSNARIKFFIRGCINPEADEADGHVDRFAFLVAVIPCYTWHRLRSRTALIAAPAWNCCSRWQTLIHRVDKPNKRHH